MIKSKAVSHSNIVIGDWMLSHISVSKGGSRVVFLFSKIFFELFGPLHDRTAEEWTGNGGVALPWQRSQHVLPFDRVERLSQIDWNDVGMHAAL